MPFIFTNCQGLSFNHSSMQDIGGNYYVHNTSNIDNRHHCQNVSYNDSSQRDNQNGNPLDDTYINMDNRDVTEEYFSDTDTTNGVTGSSPLPRGGPTRRDVDIPPNVQQNPRPSHSVQSHTEFEHLPAQSPEGMTRFPDGTTSPVTPNSEDRMEAEFYPIGISSKRIVRR